MHPGRRAVSNRANMEIDKLLWAARSHDADGQTDGQLLGQFLARRDEAAFATLVKRHGPMVLGVCRRILGHADGAEDAFQAAFIVLVRKAPSLTSRAVLGDWLHGVARRTALNAKRAAARRRRKEEAMARPETQSEEVRDDRLSLLDEVLTRLPEKYRLAIVLCELEGWTRREAAERLGWPEGTVAGRLARGRALLAKRLMRQGLALSTASMASVFSPETASACVPAPLASSTINAATLIAAGQAATTGAISAPVAALAEGVLKGMLLNKLKLAAVVLFGTVLLGAGVTAGAIAYQAADEKPPASQPATVPKGSQDRNLTPDRTKQAQRIPDKKGLAPAAPDKDDRIRPGDLLDIRVPDTLPNAPIQAVFQVEASGKVALGAPYGRVEVKGLTLEEAEAVIRKHLAKALRDPVVSVTRPVPAHSELERRVQQLEMEVRTLRALVEELRKKARD